MNKQALLVLLSRCKIRRLAANEKCKIVEYNDENITLQITITGAKKTLLKSFKELADFFNENKNYINIFYISHTEEVQTSEQFFNYLAKNLKEYNCDISYLKDKFLNSEG